jgi:hypothetical protein
VYARIDADFLALVLVVRGSMLSFGAGDDGPKPRGAVESTSANAAIRTAERMTRSDGHIGAVAFSRTGDPAGGEFADAVFLKAFGEVPSDLSAL